MVFLLFCLFWIFVAKMLVASTTVGLLCGQKLIEGLDQTLQLRGGQVAKLALVQLADRLIQSCEAPKDLPE